MVDDTRRLFICAAIAIAVSASPVGAAGSEVFWHGEEGEQSRAAKPRLKKDENGDTVPDVRAAAAIIYDPISGEVIWGENSDVRRSIASLTKLMTVVVFLESEHDLSETITVSRSDVRRASTTYLRRNERLRVDDLLHLALVASDNGAARALARLSAGGSERFVERMNEKAVVLGLKSTVFTDPSGLDAGNLSSAYDLSRLIVYAGGNEKISRVMRLREHRITTNRRRVRIRNTNKLLGGEINHRVTRGETLSVLARRYDTTISAIQSANALGRRTLIRIGQQLRIPTGNRNVDASSSDVIVWAGKTGFIRKAGYCLAALLQLPQGKLVAVVVLGARSNAARFQETRRLIGWLNMRPAE